MGCCNSLGRYCNYDMYSIRLSFFDTTNYYETYLNTHDIEEDCFVDLPDRQNVIVDAILRRITSKYHYESSTLSRSNFDPVYQQHKLLFHLPEDNSILFHPNLLRYIIKVKNKVILDMLKGYGLTYPIIEQRVGKISSEWLLDEFGLSNTTPEWRRVIENQELDGNIRFMHAQPNDQELCLRFIENHQHDKFLKVIARQQKSNERAIVLVCLGHAASRDMYISIHLIKTYKLTLNEITSSIKESIIDTDPKGPILLKRLEEWMVKEYHTSVSLSQQDQDPPCALYSLLDDKPLLQKDSTVMISKRQNITA
jgi:hypothetical protein